MDPANPLAAVKKCIPAEWGGTKGAADEAGFQYAQNGNNIIKKILDWKYKAVCAFGYCAINLSTDGIVEKICSYATQIISFLSRRRFRRMMIQKAHNKHALRLLYQRALTKVFRRRWSLWEKIKEAVSSVCKSTLETLKSWFNKLMSAVAFVKKLIAAFKCLKTLAQGIVETVKRRITGLVNAVNTIVAGAWAGCIKVIIKTICVWSVFKQALKDCIDAFSNTGQKRWTLLGRCVGGIFSAIADGNA
jgi:hypothetical protein